jgi:CRP/FNR family nitrogen fixation transcriptional regulator
MSYRLSDGPGKPFALPMSRYDIADYLAISVETVSRCISAFKAAGAIRLSGRHEIAILNREGLGETG